MTNYTPTDALSTVQTYDESDLVKGGTTGESNGPIKALADQSLWLQNRLGGYRDVQAITSNTTISVSSANKLLSVTATANVTLTLAAVNTFKPGARIAVVANLSGSGSPFFVNVVAADNINNGSATRTNIWVYDGEMIELIAGTSTWLWTIAKGNFDKVGECDLKRFAPKNTLIANGTSGLLRTQYPRLWEAISAGVVADGSWSSTERYKGQFSNGNGTTTFRTPDYRAMYFRALDLSRNISLARLDQVAGGYEADGIVDHYHNTIITDNANSAAGSGKITTGNDANEGSIPPLKSSGPLTGSNVSIATTETRTKNLGFTPYLYY